MIDLKDLEYLFAVSKTGAINKAADRLGISQPALTRRIQKLEKQFDLKLLDRQPKGVKLTQIGTKFLTSGQKLLAHSRDFEAEMKLHLRGRGGTIKIGIKPGLDDLFFKESILRFNMLYPDTVIRIYVGATPYLMRQLRNGELDLAFGALGYADEFGNEFIMSQELTFDPFLKVPLALYVRKGHPVLASKNIEEGLFEYPLTAPTPPLAIIQKIQSAYETKGEAYKVPQILVDDFSLAAKIVSQSDHWSAIYEPIFNQLKQYGNFHSLGSHPFLPPLNIGIVQRKTWTVSPWARQLLDIVADVAKPWLI